MAVVPSRILFAPETLLEADPAVAAEAEAFLRQEALHARAHRDHVAALTKQYPGLAEVSAEIERRFDHLLETRSLAFHLAYAADIEATFTPMFKQQGSGHIVNVASLAGLVHPAGMGSYNAVKAAVVAFSETTAHELAGHGVCCSVVCPSYFRTGLVDRMQGRDAAVGEVIGALVEAAPLGPEDIAAAVLEGMDRGEELILPDEAARAAYQLKVTDRAAYDTVMRKQAARLDAMGAE